jgi:hypothetical protein
LSQQRDCKTSGIFEFRAARRARTALRRQGSVTETFEMSQLNFWIDRGGTFTDAIGRDPQGGRHARKMLSAGAPAGPEFDGAPGVHTDMTDSCLTDSEILETRFPVVPGEFSIRQGSGGQAVTGPATAHDAPFIFWRRWNAQFSSVIAARNETTFFAGRRRWRSAGKECGRRTQGLFP